jgi:FtsP/CotA-like multicopper oxidase with cupredoxin domain
MFIPGFGPPRDYNTPNADGAVGGNPAFSAYLTDQRVPPDPTENGWKDTLKMLPRQVTRIVARWAPQRVRPADVQPGQNLYSFDATSGPGYGWHCHILDHEDNVMMRPYLPIQ